MCTALSFRTENHYFGRNLDIDCSYGEEVCVVPRNYPFPFVQMNTLKSHCAIIGMAAVIDDFPLFYDGANEYGLAMAGLNFPGNACYKRTEWVRENIAPFELIPRVLCECKNVKEARALLSCINITDIPFKAGLPLSPLHWIISDDTESIVAEPMKEGICVHDNPAHVLTNNPPFQYQLFNLNNYRNLGPDNGENRFSDKLELDNYCRGLGAWGLPGDASSMSRFVKTVFGRENSACEMDEMSSVSQFFHILSSVEMLRGSCVSERGDWDITLCSSCINTQRCLYYYTTYDNRQITCVDMKKENLNGCSIIRFPLVKGQNVFYQN